MNALAVALGGALGSLARYSLSLWLPSQLGHWPLATLLANLSGCFIMGVFYGVIVVKQLWPSEWRPFLMVGLLGGFTTFSSFALETLSLLQQGLYTNALGYSLCSLMGSLFAVAAGFALVQLLSSL